MTYLNLAIFFLQCSIILFLTSEVGFTPSLRTMNAFATCILYGCGIPITVDISTSGCESITLSIYCG